MSIPRDAEPGLGVGERAALKRAIRRAVVEDGGVPGPRVDHVVEGVYSRLGGLLHGWLRAWGPTAVREAQEEGRRARRWARHVVKCAKCVCGEACEEEMRIEIPEAGDMGEAWARRAAVGALVVFMAGKGQNGRKWDLPEHVRVAAVDMSVRDGEGAGDCPGVAALRLVTQYVQEQCRGGLRVEACWWVGEEKMVVVGVG